MQPEPYSRASTNDIRVFAAGRLSYANDLARSVRRLSSPFGQQQSPLPNKNSVAYIVVHKSGRIRGRGACTFVCKRYPRRTAWRDLCSATGQSGSKTPIRLTVNGRIHDVGAAPDTALLYVLRNDLELNGPKYGCGLGECGTCAVLIDGVAARSCVIPIEGCVGREVVTLEGLGIARTSRSGAGSLHRRAGRAMRLLPQRHDHDHQGAADAQPASV